MIRAKKIRLFLPRGNDLRKQMTPLKKNDLAWLNEVSNNIPKQAVKDGGDAYKNSSKD